MPSKTKFQHGYLLILAIVLITIVGFFGGTLSYMYTSATRSNLNALKSNEALYVAQSGLELAKRKLLRTGTLATCADINGAPELTNAAYPLQSSGSSTIGQFTVVGTETNTSALLGTGGINNVVTTIPVSSITGFLQSGVVVIDGEAIWYGGISGLTLINAKRGAFNTAASAHTAGKKVTHRNCELTCTAGVPTLANPYGKRVLRNILWAMAGLGSLPGDMIPTLIAGGGVKLNNGASVCNPTITGLGDPRIGGSTIISGGDIELHGPNDHTTVGSNCDIPGNGSDMSLNNPDFTGDKLWDYFFNRSKEEIENDPAVTKVTDCANYDFYTAASGIYWLSCDGKFYPKSKTIGTPENPVMLIADETTTVGSDLILNGMMYVMGDFNLNSGASFSGAVVAEGKMILNMDSHLTFNSDILRLMGLFNTYKKEYYPTQEVFN